MYRYLIQSFILASSLSVGAAGAQILTEDKVIEYALTRNELNEITKNQIEQAQTKIKQAKSGYFPTLKASAEINHSWIVPTDSTLAKTTAEDGWVTKKAAITLSQPLFTFGQISSGVEIAKQSGELARIQGKATIAEVKKTTRLLYHNAIYYKSILKIAQESLDNANKNAKALNDRVQFGRINQNDNIKMQADVAARKPLLTEARKGLEAAISDLSSFLNLPESSLTNIPDSLDKKSFIKAESEPIQNFANLQAAKTQFEVASAREKVASGANYPTVSAYASYLPTNTNLGGAFGNSMFFNDQAVVGLRVDWEIPVGGAKYHEKKAAVYDRVNADLNIKRLSREIEKKQESIVRQYKLLEEKDKALQESSTLADRSYKVALQAFKTGGISQLQLNDSEIHLTNQKMNLAQNRIQMKSLLASLEQLQTEGN